MEQLDCLEKLPWGNMASRKNQEIPYKSPLKLGEMGNWSINIACSIAIFDYRRVETRSATSYISMLRKCGSGKNRDHKHVYPGKFWIFLDIFSKE
jgi:hypothetical protein